MTEIWFPYGQVKLIRTPLRNDTTKKYSLTLKRMFFGADK